MPRRKLSVAPSPPPSVPDLRVAVEDALAAMDWLGDSDGALRVLALRVAGEIEASTTRADALADVKASLAGEGWATNALRRLEAQCDATRTVAALAPHLQSILRDLGGSPATRRALQPDQPIGGRLAQLRAAAASPVGVDDS